MCLDENPEERPSADDLMKCKLVKIYKNHPTSILKEVISRYLLWRDRNSSRDSVFINLENEQEDSVDEIVNKTLMVDIIINSNNISSSSRMITKIMMDIITKYKSNGISIL